jgi:hypothetical protein
MYQTTKGARTMISDQEAEDWGVMTEEERRIFKIHCAVKALLAAIALGILLSFCVVMFTVDSVCAAELDLTKAVIHHTASGDVPASEIDRWHKEKGWDGIGYHYVIRKDGTIEEGRSLERKGAHALNGRPYSRNHYVGIVLTGHNDFSQLQIKSLKRLLRSLDVGQIENHHQKCPGHGLDLASIARELNIKFEEVK